MKVEREWLEKWCRGNRAAVQMLSDLLDVSQLWDDLIDLDKVPADKYINDRFYKALISIPRNPFYREHFGQISTVLEQAIVSWFVATSIERQRNEDETLNMVAFITRSDYINLIVLCAGIIGGVDWATQVAFDIRKLVHEEGLAGYRDAVREEAAARGEN